LDPSQKLAFFPGFNGILPSYPAGAILHVSERSVESSANRRKFAQNRYGGKQIIPTKTKTNTTETILKTLVVLDCLLAIRYNKKDILPNNKQTN